MNGADTRFSRAPTTCVQAMEWTDKLSKDNRKIGSNHSTSETGMGCKANGYVTINSRQKMFYSDGQDIRGILSTLHNYQDFYNILSIFSNIAVEHKLSIILYDSQNRKFSFPPF